MLNSRHPDEALCELVLSMTSPIELVFCLHQKSPDSPYPMALAATYISIRQRTNHPLCLHLIVDSTVEESSLQSLRSTIKADDELRVVHASEVPEAEHVARQALTHYSPAVVWRAWIPEYLSTSKRCLLLDCDLIALTDVYRIWSLDLNGKSLAAKLRRKPHSEIYHDWIQTPPDRYFRMCIVLMDLDAIRANRSFIRERATFLQATANQRQSMPQADLLEQSLFNRYFSDSCLPLNLEVPAPDYLRQNITDEHLKIPSDKAYQTDSLGSVVDIKGWMNKSPECLHFWSALLETPWRARAIDQFLRIQSLAGSESKH